MTDEERQEMESIKARVAELERAVGIGPEPDVRPVAGLRTMHEEFVARVRTRKGMR